MQSFCTCMGFENIYFHFCRYEVPRWRHQMEHFPRSWPFVRKIYRSPVNPPPPHKGHWCRTLMFSFIWAWINSWVNNHEAGDFRCHRAHYDVTVMHLVWYIDFMSKQMIWKSTWESKMLMLSKWLVYIEWHTLKPIRYHLSYIISLPVTEQWFHSGETKLIQV